MDDKYNNQNVESDHYDDDDDEIFVTIFIFRLYNLK